MGGSAATTHPSCEIIHTMLAIGVDLIELERIAATLARFDTRFLNRVYTPDELAYCAGRLGSLAARWAAKEATAKALGTGIGDVAFREIEVVRDERGAPALRLHGAAAALAAARGLDDWTISLSHTRTTAIAFVVARKSAEC
jgi:holo-[acyl-carrier protein] synthase